MAEERSPEFQEALRSGYPFLVWHDAGGREHVLSLPDSWQSLTVGRGMSCDLILHWDDDTSRIHAELRRMGDDWVLVDEGLSRNGSWLNGERVTGRRRLSDGDTLRFGQTEIAFFAPLQATGETRAVTRFDLKTPPADA